MIHLIYSGTINNFHHADFLPHQFDCIVFLFSSFLFSGRPTPTVRWLVNGLIYDEQIEQTTGDLTENRLMWPSAQRSDLNSIFTCQAINTPLVEPRESSFVLDLHRKFKLILYNDDKQNNNICSVYCKGEKLITLKNLCYLLFVSQLQSVVDRIFKKSSETKSH